MLVVLGFLLYLCVVSIQILGSYSCFIFSILFLCKPRVTAVNAWHSIYLAEKAAPQGEAQVRHRRFQASCL